MPYIKNDQRLQLNVDINTLARRISEVSQGDDSSFCGILNYCITRLILSSIKTRFGNIRYYMICLIDGVLTNVGREIYRRVSEKYEDRKIEENGDLEEFL